MGVRTRTRTRRLGVSIDRNNSNEERARERERERELQLSSADDSEAPTATYVPTYFPTAMVPEENEPDAAATVKGKVDDADADIKEKVKDAEASADAGKEKDTKGEKNEVVVGDNADLGVVFIPGSSEFDIEDIEIESFAFVKSCTAEYGENIPAGSKCVELFLTFDSYSGDLSEADLTLMSTDVEDTIESGTFAEEILKTGLAATVIVPLPPALATDAPTSEPTTLEPTFLSVA